MKINFRLPYDNEAAHSQIKLMMKCRLRINIEFMENSDNIPSVWLKLLILDASCISFLHSHGNGCGNI